MKKCILIIMMTMLPAWLFAEPIDSLVAKQVATTFMENQTARGCLKSAQLTNYQCQKEGNIYIVNNAGGGWVLVSADDCVRPILAYSPDGEFSTDNIAPAAKAWFDSYNLQIEAAQNTDNQSDREVSREWKQLKNGEVGGNKDAVVIVEPLIKTKWDQGTDGVTNNNTYNFYCPLINDTSTVTGCVATAIAQVMKKWEWPRKGVGFHDYNSLNCGKLSSVFAVNAYDWDDMPVQVFPNSSITSIYAVSKLMFDIGVSVEMNYGLSSTGGSGISNLQKVRDAMVKYFKYSQDMTLEYKDNYTDLEWINKLKNELNNDRPILYYGFGEGGGHAFICDGYDTNDYFHFNWGWGGLGDAYYYINELTPSYNGTGSNLYGTYNVSQQAFIGVRPSYDKQDYDLRMYENSLWMSDDKDIQLDKFWFGSDVYYHANVANYGINTFSGSFVVGTFDNKRRFVAFSDTVNVVLQDNKYVTMTFKVEGDFKYLPKNYYYAYVFYKDEFSDDWVAVSNSDGQDNSLNFAIFDIYYSTPIEVNSNIAIYDNYKKEAISSNVFVSGDEYTYTVKIINNSSEEYIGKYRLSLLNNKGKFIKVIGDYDEKQPLKPNDTHDIMFQNSIDVEPGTYILSISYYKDDSWYTAGATDGFYNQLYYDVVVEYEPDQYEDNDIIDKAYPFELDFDENNYCYPQTVTNNNNENHFANLHKYGDVDYYKYKLEQGYNYEVKATVLNTKDEHGVFTVDDVIVEYSYDGATWFEGFDYEYRSSKSLNDPDRYDVLVAQNGGTIYVRIYHPWGMKGIYYFYSKVYRTPNTAISSIDVQSEISVYPNPAVDYLNVNVSDYCAISNIVIYDHQGRQVLASSDTRINVSALNKGIYIVEIRTDKGTAHRKFTKQ